MTISSTNRKAGPYAGNDSTTAFPFAFKVFSAGDLLVVRADSSGAESTLMLNTDYTVALNADQDESPGGTVTLSAALATGYTLVVSSSLENLQPTDLTNQGGFYPRVISTALDRQTILIQQLAESVSRSLKTSITTPPGVNPTLPTPVPYQLIGWNGDGTGLQNTDPTYSTALATDLSNSDNALKGVALVAGTNRVASSIAALRALPKTGTKNVLVSGYYAAGDGGGGHYYLDESDTTSADNGGTVIVAADGGRWKLSEQGAISVKQFGAKGDGVADDTATIQAALNTGRSVYSPKGTYKCLGKLYMKGTGQTLYGDGYGETVFNYTGASGVFINGALSNPITSGANWQSEYGDTLYLADGAKIRDMTIQGTWVANSTNTSIGVAGQFGGVNYGGLTNVQIRNFAIGVQMAGSIQYCRGVWFTSCLFGWKTAKTVAPYSSNFNDTFLIDGCWASWCGQSITQTPSAVSLLGSIVTITVPDASKFMQWTAVTQAATNAGAVIQAINTGTNQLTCYVYKGTFNTSAIVNAQGACFWLSEATQNCRFTHNEISESAQGIVTMFGGLASYVDQFWVDIGMWGPALIEANSGSIVQGPIGFTGVSSNDFVTDPNLYSGYSSVGYKTARYNDGSVPGYGMTLPNDSPIRTLYSAGWRAAITNKVVQVFGAGAGATDSGAAAVQYSWVVNKSSGNAPVVLSIGYHNAIATAPYLSTGELTPLPLTGKLLDLVANGVSSVLQPSVDALVSLGAAANRWNVVYAATGTINTSDEREKQQSRPLNNAEKAVALRLKSLVRVFKFNDAVKQKGEAARIHCGVIAQDVKAAFEAEGLVAENYAVLCYDEWDATPEERNDNGDIVQAAREAGSRYGVRYEELLAFIIAAL